MNYLDDLPKPLEMHLPEEIIDKLRERYEIENILIIYFPVTIGPVLKFFLKKTKFTMMIADEPEILGEITIIGKYAKAIKLRSGPVIYLRDFKLGNTLIMVMIETSRISARVEEFMENLVLKILEKGELDPLVVSDIITELVK